MTRDESANMLGLRGPMTWLSDSWATYAQDREKATMLHAILQHELALISIPSEAPRDP